jgi:hypothetical protein
MDSRVADNVRMWSASSEMSSINEEIAIYRSKKSIERLKKIHTIEGLTGGSMNSDPLPDDVPNGASTRTREVVLTRRNM